MPPACSKAHVHVHRARARAPCTVHHAPCTMHHAQESFAFLLFFPFLLGTLHPPSHTPFTHTHTYINPPGLFQASQVELYGKTLDDLMEAYLRWSLKPEDRGTSTITAEGYRIERSLMDCVAPRPLLRGATQSINDLEQILGC